MSQRAEKYARSMERRVDELEKRADTARGELFNCGRQLTEIREDVDRNHAACAYETDKRQRMGGSTGRRLDHHMERILDIERAMFHQRVAMAVTLVLAVFALTVAIAAYNMGQAGAERVQRVGTTCTECTGAVLKAAERQARTENAWVGG